MFGLALIFGVTLLAAVMVRVATAIPASARDPVSGAMHPRPQFPSWVRRTWLVGVQLAFMLVVSYGMSPGGMIFWWSLAGPFTMTRFDSNVSVVWSASVAAILAIMAAAHPVKPNWFTALICVVGCAAWFTLGFCTIRVAV